MDIFKRVVENPGPLGKFAEYGEGYFIFPELEGDIGPRMKFKGKEVVVWSVNNYLGLANHPEVRKADAESVANYGLAYPMGSRLMSGQTSKHAQLEKELAEFVGKEDAFLVNFGYQSMVSAIDALVTRRDVIIYDDGSHACIVDGVRLHVGKRFTFLHNDVDNLVKQLERATAITEKTGGGILVITEGVFGMQGEQGAVKEIVKLKDRYDFRILVDDAHGFGVLGKRGAGVGEEQGVTDEIDLYFSTFAKSMAGIGAFFAADKEIIDYLKYNARSQVFAKSLPMGFVEGGLKRLDLIRNHPELKENLWKVVDMLQKGLRERGYNIGNTESCVTPVFMKGEPLEACEMVRDLREAHGIFCSVVVYPVVPKDVILIRLIPTAVHTEKEVIETLEAFDAVKEKLDRGVYKEQVPTE
ncbi:aminotransferase class I/II-fold pyridoxal phosphate-dependent enzyme [Membranihabitans maritimus]|uniref:aminotransferase class I/II-fold pyridoxal phosphate-dependent enzyme n=1 Tax=Membranihabitans maritimus TaxID=2904244 RepID=UPI001F004FDA|nr:aminotransferase class I/II-fold pyridoxal phosphate-dependent enzyme [Membranihabitans maritimus]